MAVKQSSYITVDLDWLETQLATLKEKVEDLLTNSQDRYGPRMLPNGRVVEALITSEEDKLKIATMVMEKIPKILQAVNELRKIEEEKNINVRGSQGLSPLETGEI